MVLSKRVLCASLLLPGLTFGEARTTPFTLGKYIPGDVWMYIHEVHNPERDFICAHWERVFSAAARSGIDQEIKKLIIAELPEDERAEFEAKWDKVRSALTAVPWGELGAVEFAMGQRIVMPMPNYMFLFKNKPSRTEAIMPPLTHLLKTMASLSGECVIRESKKSGAAKHSLCIDKVGAVFEVFARGDVIGIAVGQGVADEMISLMEAKNEGKSIVADATFQKALKSIEPPEDMLKYFRVTNFIRAFRDFLLKETAGDEDAKKVMGIVSKVVSHVDVLDYSIWTRRTDGLHESFSGVTKLLPGSGQKPLVRALTKRKMFDKFDRFVPKDAGGFTVSAGVDLGLLYDTVINFIKTEIPEGGPALIAKWDALQETIGFNPRRDLFDWLSGEFVTVNLSGGMSTQMNFVVMVRTTKPELAAEKVNTLLDMVAGKFPQVMISPAPEVGVEGFRTVFVPMMMMWQLKPVIGVHGEWLVLGTTPKGVKRCLDTAKGKTPSIRANKRFQKEGLMGEGQVSGASFSDMSHLGQGLGMALGMCGMAGSFLPDQEETRPIKTVFSLLARLAPVVAEINFYSSKASMSHFTGDGWVSRTKMTYKPQEVVAVKDAP
ncbi:MAG: hypothetical protein V3W34_00990 [Phycisphaerae bacterium]